MIKRIGALGLLVLFLFSNIWAIQLDCYSEASPKLNLAQVQYYGDLEYCEGRTMSSFCVREAGRKYDAALYRIGQELDDCLKSVSGH